MNIDKKQTHYTHMRPQELRKRRLECPVGYLPIGTLEWHGFHNPLGLDGIKSERVLSYIANELGGIVLPPQYWADDRSDIADVIFDSAVTDFIPEEVGDHVTPICEAMALSRSRLESEAKRSITNGRWRLWQEVIVQTLFQSESLGFDLLVLYPGHYPMHTPVARAVETFKSKGGVSDVFILTDHLVAQGDHAAAFETSLMLFLASDLVDLSALSPTDSMHLGVLGEDPLEQASAELGRSTVAQFLTIVQEQIQLSKKRKNMPTTKR